MQEVLQTLLGESHPLYPFCNVLLSAYEGSSTEKLSAIYSETLYHFLLGGLSSAHQNVGTIEHLWVKGGNGVLPEKLAHKLCGRVHLNHILTSIEKNAQGSYVLSFQNGHTVICDVLVLTIPCPVYKTISIAPTVIPKERQRSISSIQYGTNAKILAPILCPQKDVGAFLNDRISLFLNNDAHIVNMYYTQDFGLFTASTIERVFQKDLPSLNRHLLYKILSPPPLFWRKINLLLIILGLLVIVGLMIHLLKDLILALELGKKTFLPPL